MAKIHLLGGNGYIGALLVNYLRAAGHVVETASYRLPDVPPKSIVADIVIYLAASGGGTKYRPRNGWNDHSKMHNININGMKSLLLGIVNKHTKIIFISSSAVYGKFQEPPLLDENATLKPVSVYGRHKVESENILRDSDFDWLIFRPCSIFGPSVNGRFGNSFHNVVIDNAIQTGQITIMGGDQNIDTLYIIDLIKIILRSCADEWYSRETFNVSGEITTVENMINVLGETIENLGITCEIFKNDYSNQPSVLIDTSKLKQSFPGWRTTPLHYAMHSLAAAHFQCYN